MSRRVLDHGLRGGRAVHRRYRWGATTVRYLRWCDAHVALGLVDAAAALQGIEDLAPRASQAAPVAARLNSLRRSRWASAARSPSRSGRPGERR